MTPIPNNHSELQSFVAPNCLKASKSEQLEKSIKIDEVNYELLVFPCQAHGSGAKRKHSTAFTVFYAEKYSLP